MKDGVFLSLEDSKKSIQPAFFKNSVLPLTKKDFPRNMIIPQCHVRFVVGMRFWADLMPQFFANNLMPARATFAMSVMGLYASKIWGGETGFGVSLSLFHSFPITDVSLCVWKARDALCLGLQLRAVNR